MKNARIYGCNTVNGYSIFDLRLRDFYSINSSEYYSIVAIE